MREKSHRTYSKSRVMSHRDWQRGERVRLGPIVEPFRQLRTRRGAIVSEIGRAAAAGHAASNVAEKDGEHNVRVGLAARNIAAKSHMRVLVAKLLSAGQCDRADRRFSGGGGS